MSSSDLSLVEEDSDQMAAVSPFIHLGTREVCVCVSKHNECKSVFSFHQLVKATE